MTTFIQVILIQDLTMETPGKSPIHTLLNNVVKLILTRKCQVTKYLEKVCIAIPTKVSFNDEIGRRPFTEQMIGRDYHVWQLGKQIAGYLCKVGIGGKIIQKVTNVIFESYIMFRDILDCSQTELAHDEKIQKYFECLIKFDEQAHSDTTLKDIENEYYAVIVLYYWITSDASAIPAFKFLYGEWNNGPTAKIYSKASLNLWRDAVESFSSYVQCIIDEIQKCQTYAMFQKNCDRIGIMYSILVQSLDYVFDAYMKYTGDVDFLNWKRTYCNHGYTFTSLTPHNLILENKKPSWFFLLYWLVDLASICTFERNIAWFKNCDLQLDTCENDDRIKGNLKKYFILVKSTAKYIPGIWLVL